MTASRASRAAAGRLAILLLAGLALAGAGRDARALELAQGAPIQLVPPRPGNAPGTPTPGTPTPGTLTPGTLTPGTPTPGTPVQTRPAQAVPSETLPAPGFGASPAPGTPVAGTQMAGPKGIEVNKLGALDSDGVGTLEPGQGGLGPELWRGSPRPVVAQLLAAMPAAISSPALRDLARRVLLSRTAPPEGGKGDGPSLLSLRVGKLAAMGDTESMQALGTLMPASRKDEALARMRVEGSLLDGDTTNACADIGVQIREYHDVFWQKLQIFCQLLAKKNNEAEIGISLLHDQGDDKDQAFFALADTLEGGKGVKLASLSDASPLLLAMVRAAKLPLPEDVLHAPSPAVLRAVANNANVSLDMRLAAAERAVRLGALDPGALLQIYDRVPVKDEELKNALSKATAEYGPRARVLLYRAAKAQSVPTARAEALQAALSLARAAGVYDLAVAANLSLVDSLTPSPELAFFALEAGRAYYFAGRADAVQGWLAVARQQGGETAGTDAARGLWPFARLAAPAPGPWDDAGFRAWRDARSASKSGDKPGDPALVDLRAARLLGLFAAAGEAVPATTWQPYYASATAEPAAMPSVAVWRGLYEAALAGRRGETILFALAAIGASGTADANPIAVDRVVEALRKVGLDADARRLAIESAVAVGA